MLIILELQLFSRMDYQKALRILNLNNYIDFEDVELQYQSQRGWVQKSYNAATNETMRSTYGNKLEEIERAYQYLKENKDSIGSKTSTNSFPSKLKLKRGQRVILVSMILVAMIFVGYYGVKSYQAKQISYQAAMQAKQRSDQAEKLINEGLEIFNAAKIDQNKTLFKEAMSKFEKAEELGSVDGEYYHGMALYKLGQRSEGFLIMQSAVKNGFEDSLELRFYKTIELGTGR